MTDAERASFLALIAVTQAALDLMRLMAEGMGAIQEAALIHNRVYRDRLTAEHAVWTGSPLADAVAKLDEAAELLKAEP